MFRRLAVCLVALLPGCALDTQNQQGPLQPQAVTGPCDVKTFYLLGFTAVHTQITLRAGQGCTMTLINAALQVFPTAALVTEQPGRGRAVAGISPDGRQVVVSYAAPAGYAGPDAFAVTIEPNAFGIRYAVTVLP